MFKRNPARVSFFTLLVLVLLSQFLGFAKNREKLPYASYAYTAAILSGNVLIYTVKKI
jgi:hypothetical protein